MAKIRKDVANVFKRDRADVERATEMKGEGAVVHVLNGTDSTNAKTTRIADALDSMGVNAIVPPVNGGRRGQPGLHGDRDHALQRRPGGDARDHRASWRRRSG